MTTVQWLAAALGRFESPPPGTAPAGYEEELRRALMTSAETRRAFLDGLAAAVQEASGGLVGIAPADPADWPWMSRDLGAVHLVLTGRRRLYLAPAAEPVGFVD